MIFKPSSPETIFADLKNSFGLNEEVVFIVKPTKSYVYVGVEGYNKEACADMFVLELKYFGGTIVTTDKDLNLVIALKTNDRLQEILEKINKSLNIGGVIDGNDILLNGYKICGSAQNQIGDYFVYYFQISFDVDINKINSICTTQANKIPKGINQFSSLTREDLEKEIRKWQL